MIRENVVLQSVPNHSGSGTIKGATVELPSSNGGCVLVDVSYFETEQGPVTTGYMKLNIYKLSSFQYKIYKGMKKIKKDAKPLSSPLISAQQQVYSEYFGGGGRDIRGKEYFESNLEENFFGFNLTGETKLAVERSRNLIIKKYKEYEQNLAKEIEKRKNIKIGEGVKLGLNETLIGAEKSDHYNH